MSQDPELPRGTTAHMPDLNWSQARETVLMLELAGVSDHVSSMVHQAIIAFQVYDKLVQRLAHVGLSLGDLSDLVADRKRLFNPAEWVALQEKIKVKYSTREEIAMFDAVMQGMPVQEAIEKFMAEMKEKSDDIELF